MKHAMKVVERIFEHRIRQQTEIDDMQFGFMKGKGTTDAIFMARQTKENFREGKKLYFGFVDLEKTFDRVPRKVISWAMRKLVVEEWLVSRVARSPVVYGRSRISDPFPGGSHREEQISRILLVRLSSQSDDTVTRENFV